LAQLELVGDSGREYQIRDAQPLAVGRVSFVYRALDPNGSEVCVKQFFAQPRAQPESGFQAFSREVEAHRALAHPSIINVLDAGLDRVRGAPFLVLPYYRDGSLRDQISQRDFIPVYTAIPLLEQLAAAIDFAHSRGVIHGDIKPENVLVDLDQSRVVLADFGSAKLYPFSEAVFQTRSTQTSFGGGTTAYLSPEQLSRGSQSALSDVYSFTMVAYEILTGQLPFDTSKPPYGQMTAKIGGELISARVVNPSLTPQVEGALAAGLRPDPAERPKTAGEVTRMLRGEAPSLLEHGSRRSAMPKWREWPPAQQAAVAAAGLAALGGIVVAAIEIIPEIFSMLFGGR